MFWETGNSCGYISNLHHGMRKVEVIGAKTKELGLRIVLVWLRFADWTMAGLSAKWNQAYIIGS